jgi:CRP/FNR family transcriptional regulator, cyclic AMP receptor protein
MAGEKRARLAADPRRFLTGRGIGQSRLRAVPQQIVCPLGAPEDALFYIERGWVKISVVSPDGKEVVRALRGPGEFFGTRCLLGPHRRGAAATSLSECSFVRIGRTAVMRLVRTEPDFAEMLTVQLAERSRRDQDRLTDQLILSGERRLARTLLRLVAEGGGDGAGIISIRVNQADLASMIGTTRSRVSHFMNKFRRMGLIAYNRQGYVTVHKTLSKASLDR